MSYRINTSNLVAAYKFFKQNPEGSITTGIWTMPNMTRAEFKKWFVSCLHKKTGGEALTEKDWDLIWDARVVNEYYGKRIRHSGSRGMLRTEKMRKKYPHINNQPYND